MTVILGSFSVILGSFSMFRTPQEIGPYAVVFAFQSTGLTLISTSTSLPPRVSPIPSSTSLQGDAGERRRMKRDKDAVEGPATAKRGRTDGEDQGSDIYGGGQALLPQEWEEAPHAAGWWG